jgi:hypothetical protein
MKASPKNRNDTELACSDLGSTSRRISATTSPVPVVVTRGLSPLLPHDLLAVESEFQGIGRSALGPLLPNDPLTVESELQAL